MEVQYTERMAAAVRAAGELAVAQRSPELFTVHLLTVLSAADDSTFYALLVAQGIDLTEFHAFTSDRSRKVLSPSPNPVKDVRPSQENMALLQGAVSEMRELDDSRLGTEHVLLAALKYRPGKGAWSIFGLTYTPVRESLDSVRKSRRD